MKISTSKCLIRSIILLFLVANPALTISRAHAAPKAKEKANEKTAPHQKKTAQKAKGADAKTAPPASKSTAPAAAPADTKKATSFGSGTFNTSKEPTNISADSLTLFNEKRTFTYQGKVVVTQADMTLKSDFLDGNYSEKNEIEKIIARSNVEITKGADIKATGQRAEYNALNRTIVLTETPSIEQNGSTLTADLIRIFIDENRSIAEGNVKVTMKSADDGLGRATPVGTAAVAAPVAAITGTPRAQ